VGGPWPTSFCYGVLNCSFTRAQQAMRAAHVDRRISRRLHSETHYSWTE